MKIKLTRAGKVHARMLKAEREAREQRVYIEYLEQKLTRAETAKSLREIWRDPNLSSEKAKERSKQILDQYEEEEGIAFVSP